MNAIVAILPVARPDLGRAIKWLRWTRALAAKPDAWPYELVVFAAKSLDASALALLRDTINGWLHVTLEINPDHYEHPELGYGAMANQMFRAALELTERKFPGQPTLWVESDAIPTGPDWMLEIFTEYVTCGKPFMGDFHSHDCQIPHMTGNAVYPPNWRELAPSIATLPGNNPSQGWDTQCAAETLPQSHHSFRIQQVWLQPMPAFTEANVSMLHPETSLFHRCKDGTLIDVLARRHGIAPIPAITAPRVMPARMPAGRSAVGVTRDGARTEILITSFKRDAEFTGYCLRSIEKNAKGFAGVTLMVPTTDRRFFTNIPRNVTVKTFTEAPGKGFLHHMIQICRADEICPNADRILHVDPDCMFWLPATPEDFAPGGKCIVVRESYEVLEKRQPNRLFWKTAVEAATGIIATHDLMVRHPFIFPRELYGHTRALVESHTGMSFNDYVLSGKNSFPQSVAEFPMLGNVGLRDFPDSFSVVDYDYERDCNECGVTTRQHQYIYRSERDKLVEGYSYNVARYRNDWNKFSRGIVPRFYVK